MRFWDTSAFLQLIIKQSGSILLTRLLQADREIAIWWGTRLEALSGLMRGLREGVLSQRQFDTARENLSRLSSECFIVEPTTAVLERAERLLMIHNLRAADALQLGAALVLFREKPASNYFISTDSRLIEAAKKEGFLLIPD